MRKKWNICLVCLVCLLTGCRQEEDVTFFTEEVLRQQMSSVESGIQEAVSGEEVQVSETAMEEIMVYVCGAVEKPGVITLPGGSRMNDAVQAAGGFTEDAAYNSVNLAAKLADEEMIYIPTNAEVKAPGEAESAELSGDAGGLVNINTADLHALCSLPGIGESKAREIMAYREEKGAFQKKEDIMQVTGIKESLYRKISDLISVK